MAATISRFDPLARIADYATMNTPNGTAEWATIAAVAKNQTTAAALTCKPETSGCASAEKKPKRFSAILATLGGPSFGQLPMLWQ